MNTQAISEQQIIKENKAYMITMYVFYFLGMTFLPIVGMLVGVIMAYCKRRKMLGTIYFEHCTWLIRTFWYPIWANIILALLFITVWIIPIVGGFAIATIHVLFPLVGIWYIARVIFGFIKLLMNQGVNADSWFF